MTLRRVRSRWFALPLLVVLIVPHGLIAQQDKVAALKQSLAREPAAAAAVQVGRNDGRQHEGRGEVAHPEAVLLWA